MKGAFDRIFKLLDKIPECAAKAAMLVELRRIVPEIHRLQVQSVYGRGIAMDALQALWGPRSVPRGKR